MRRYSFDHYEFYPPDSEQSLEVAISSPLEHNEFDSFLKSCGSSGAGTYSPLLSWPRWTQVANHLNDLIGLQIPHPTQFITASIICDDWNDVEIAFAFNSHLVWYHWSTSA
jgi:hypothetical protein